MTGISRRRDFRHCCARQSEIGRPPNNYSIIPIDLEILWTRLILLQISDIQAGERLGIGENNMGRMALLALGLVALYVVVVSAPDIKRYVRISRM